jgi:Divergent InlB B-repeat domain
VKRLTVLLAALGALLLVSAAPALASEYEFEEAFGSAAQPSFGNAAGMAVDPATGDLYVIDLSDQTLHRYNPDGTPANFSALAGNVIDGHAGEADATPNEQVLGNYGYAGEVQVAIAPPGSAAGTAGDIYVTDSASSVIDVFASSGEYLGQLTESSEGGFGETCGVAVDAAGTVYVGDYNQGIHKFLPTANVPFEATSEANFASSEPCNVAAGSGPTAGYIFVNRYAGEVTKIDSEGAEEGETKFTIEGNTTTIAVDPETGYLFRAHGGGESSVNEFDASGETEATVVQSIPFASFPQGLAVEGPKLYVSREGEANVEVFSNGEEEEEGEAKNRRALTITKSPDPAAGEGQGIVQSKPKGVKCGYYCSEAVAQMYLETPVTLKEKPGKTSTFVEWTGACSGSEETCTVPMAEAEEVGAVFTGTSKVLSPAEGLTVEKAGDGEGTVKGTAGLGCEALCSSTEVLYQGPVTEPKPKAGKKVTLKQSPAFGSAFVGWEGCAEEVEGSCVVFMEEDLTVVAEYEALPDLTLTVDKTYATGNGQVQSKPKGIKCGYYCTQAVAAMPEGSEIELKAKPGKETTFVEWVGGDCDESTELVCVVTMDEAEATEAVFSNPSKALKEGSEATLTLTKAGSGFGTVKAAGGLGCEALCLSTDVVYQGPVLEPKPKPGKTVLLRAYSAPGSGPVQWSGCEEEPEPEPGFVECEVHMEEDMEVTASFEELE